MWKGYWQQMGGVPQLATSRLYRRVRFALLCFAYSDALAKDKISLDILT